MVLDGIEIGSVGVGRVVLAILVFFAVLVLGGIVGDVIRGLLERSVSMRVAKTARRVVQYVIVAVGVYVVLVPILRLDAAAIVASAGIITIAIAFSAQQVVQNLIAGVLIVLRRPIRIEDYVELAGTGVCRVRDITLFHTVLKAVNGREIFVPNAVLLNSIVTNYSRSEAIEVGVPLTIAAGVDVERVMALAVRTAGRVEGIIPNISARERGVLQRIAPQFAELLRRRSRSFDPQVLIVDVSGGRVTLSVRFWIVAVEERERIVSAFLARLLGEFAREGIVLG